MRSLTIPREEREDSEAQGRGDRMKMKRNDDSRSAKRKDDRKPVSFQAQKSCQKLNCFFGCKEDDKIAKKK